MQYREVYILILFFYFNSVSEYGRICRCCLSYKKKEFLFYYLCSSLSLSVITFGGFVYSAVQWRSFYGIAYHNKTEVKRIPQKESEVGFTLVEGETVRIVGSAGEYDFIENGIGLKGWVERDFLLLLGGEIDPYKVLKAAE